METLILVPEAVLAYGGPGSIISGLGALLATVVTLLAAIFGFLWFPLKRLVRRIRGGSPEPSGYPEDPERPESA